MKLNKAIKKCSDSEIFIFNHSEKELKGSGSVLDWAKQIAMPFDDFNLIIKGYNDHILSKISQNENSIIIYLISDNNPEGTMALNYKTGEVEYTVEKAFANSPNANTDYFKYVMGELFVQIMSFALAIADKDTVESTVVKSLRIKRTDNKKKSRELLVKVTYIENKNSVISNPGLQDKQWTHSFSVRGHWRRIDIGKIGKDRNDEYNQESRTWVRPSKKLSHLIFEQKIRIVK